MQFSETGSPNEYGTLEETINMQVVQMIQDFINQYVDKNK
jgi:hemerythrin-like domain-containing protein